MNFKTIIPLVTASLVVPLLPLFSQEDEEAIYELSPFSVSETEDVGYLATSTLAGTRLKTPLRDVGASISIVTKEFMEDTNSNNAEDILVFVANAEVSGLGGNFSGASIGNDVNTVGAVRNATPPTRIRGLSGATLTRDYFLTSIPFDSYNTSRVVVNRGANSILFGLGSPAGIINNSLVKPTFTNQTEVAFQVAEHGSQRLTFDVDREVIEDTLAIRVAGLFDHEKYQQEPAYEKDRRIYLAFDYTPNLFSGDGFMGRTSIRGHVEVGEIDSNRPRISPPLDSLTLWWDNANQQTVPSHELDWRDTDRTLFSIPGQWWFQLGVVYPDFNSDAVSSGSGTPSAFVAITQPQFYKDGFLPGFRGIATYQDYAAGRSGWSAQREDGGFYRDIQLLDDSVFDFRNQLLDGGNNMEWAEMETFNLTLEQEFLDGNGGIEIAYDNQTWEDGYYDMINGEGQNLQVDVNTHYWWGDPDPNLGRPFVASPPVAQNSEDERETFRITAFAKVDFEDFMDNTFGKILGNHTVTGLYNTYELETLFTNHIGAGTDLKWLSNFGGRNNITGDYSNVRMMHYLGESLLNRNDPAGADVPAISGMRRFPTSVSATYFDTELQEMVTNDVRLKNYFDDPLGTVNSAGMTRQEIDSQALILQSYLLEDLIVGMVGWREDDFESFISGQPPRDPADGHRDTTHPDWQISDTPNGANKDTTFTWSVVAHTPEFIKRALPEGTELSLHYGESENFQPGAARFNLVGNPLSPPTGVTEEYGVTLSLFDNKLIARLNFFETSEQNVSLGFSSASIIGVERTYYESLFTGVNDENPQAGNYQKPPQDLLNFWGWTEMTNADGSVTVDTNPAGSIQSITSRKTDGMEFELVYNPLENWRILFNVSQQEAQQSGLDQGVLEYLALRQPVWDVTDTLLDPGANFTFSERIWEIYLKPWGVVQSQDGKLSDELREWRWNLVTQYDFKEGSLNGFGVGGALRWQDDVAIGYPVITDPTTQERVFDIANPYLGDSQLNGDFWVTYRRPIFDEKVDWELRLTIRNLIGDNDLIPIAVQPDGVASGVRIPVGELWQLSSTFSF